MSHGRDDQLYAAAHHVVDAGLRGDGSAFTPGRRVWTADAAQDLLERFVDAPELGSASFVEKLSRQLAGAPVETVQLEGELVYLHLLLPSDFGGAAKRALLQQVLALAPVPVQVPEELDAALDRGCVRAGAAYRTYRNRQIAWLVRFVVAWKALTEPERERALADPWAFRDVADSVPIGSAYSQRNGLLHLVFPGTFEDIVSRRHKAQIVAGFAPELTDPTGDEDRDLLAIRRELERQRGGPISFYAGDVERRWHPQVAADGAEVVLRGWLVRGANVHGRNLVPDWLAEGYCSVGWGELGELPAGTSRSDIDTRVAGAHPDLTSRQRAIHAGVLDRFVNQMQQGDIVATVDGAQIYVGTVAGPSTWVEGGDPLSCNRRRVGWANPESPIARDQLATSTRDRLSGQMTVSSLGADVAEFAALAGVDPDLEPEDDVPEPPQSEPVVLPEPTAGTGAMLGALQLTGGALQPWHLAPGAVVFGVGLGMVSGTLVAAILANVAQDDAGSASGLVNTTLQVGTAAGIALLGTVYLSALHDGAAALEAARATLLTSVGILALALVLSRLLPTRST